MKGHDDPMREGCAVYIGLFAWAAVVIVAVNLWDVPDSPWVGLAILCPVAISWVAVWLARRTRKDSGDNSSP